MAEKLIATFVGTDDRLVERGPAWIYWITVSPATLGTQANLDIYDGFDTGGKKVWRIDDGYPNTHSFDPPINCEQGIYVECVDSFDSYVIGYASKKWSKEG